MTHRERVERFLAHLGGQPLDATGKQTDERADWLLPDRRVIAEIKTLEDDRVAEVQR